MSTKFAVIADTHMPKGGRRIPDACVEAIREADGVIHAGDFFAPAVLEELRALNPDLHAVHGNVDAPELRRSLPATLELTIDGHRVAVLHDAGPAKGRLERLRARFPEADAVIFGHSHLALHEEADGFQIFNPGSPTERRRSPRHSMGLLIATPSGLSFSHLWL
jgi:putative phosphoesterase